MEYMHLLLINPPIYDFAAYSLWAKPVGLLNIASLFKKNNISYTYLDTLDISILNNLELKKNKIKIKNSGRHNYLKKKIEKPDCLKSIPRQFYRFGLSKERIYNFFKKIDKPDYIILTSIMTYWYIGVKEIIETAREIYDNTKIILGGIYANLCFEHALSLKADYVVTSIEEIFKILNINNYKKDFFPLPLNLYKKNFFAPIYTSFGCPYSCVYCANKYLNKNYTNRNITEIINEIIFYKEIYQIKNFAFYDDALLINKEKHFIPLFKKIINMDINVNFFCPNGLHISEINKEVAKIMKNANFQDLRLSLETSNEFLQKKLGYKTDNKAFINALNNLKEVGFKKENISVYLLVGLPHQKIEDIYSSIEFAKKFDVKIKLAEYSPIPHTALWEESKKVAKFDIAKEPVFQNNKILPVAHESLTFETLNNIKHFAHN